MVITSEKVAYVVRHFIFYFVLLLCSSWWLGTCCVDQATLNLSFACLPVPSGIRIKGVYHHCPVLQCTLNISIE